MPELTKDQIDAILKAITITFDESGLRGVKVYHGSSESELQSILSGQRNLAEDGLGGPGIYVAVGDRNLASLYCKGNLLDKDLILEGYLNSQQHFRIARIQIAQGAQTADMTKGIFQRGWQKNPVLRSLMLENFDIIDISVNTPIGISRHVVIHESAGKNAIQWLGHYKFPVALPSLQMPIQGQTKQLEWKPNNNLVVSNNPRPQPQYNPSYSSNTNYQGSKYKHVRIEYNGPVNINGQIKQVQMWKTHVYERTASGRYIFKGCINVGGCERFTSQFKQIPFFRQISNYPRFVYVGKAFLKSFKMACMPIHLYLDINYAYQSDPNRNISAAIVRGGSRFSVHMGATLGIFVISTPLGVFYSGLSLATSLPEQSDAEVNRQIEYLNNRLGPVAASYSTGDIRLGQLIDKGMRVIQKKLDETGDKIANSRVGQAVTRTLDKNINHFNDSVEKARPLFIMVPGSSCPVLYMPAHKKEEENKHDEAHPISNQESEKSNLAKPNIDKSEPLGSLFESVDPMPTTLPASPFEMQGLNSLMTIQDGIVSASYTPSSYQLSIGEKSYNQELQTTSSDLALNSPQINLPQLQANEANTNNIVSRNSYQRMNQDLSDKIKTPVLSNVRPIATTNGVGLAATVGTSGTLSAVIGEKGFIITLETLFEEGFWSTLGMGLGIGAALVGATLLGQAIYNAYLKRIEHKIQRLMNHSRKDNEFITDKITQLTSRYKCLQQGTAADFQSILNEIDATINLLKIKIDKEEQRAEKAHDLKGKAAKPHNLLRIDYQETLANLIDMKTRFELDYQREKFIEDNQQKKPSELVTLAKQLTDKQLFSQTDSAHIDGLKHLIETNIVKFAIQGEIDKAQTLIAKLSGIHYYSPGNLHELKFDILLGVVDGKTQAVLNPINNKITEINEFIGRGADPRPMINALIKYIEEEANVVANFEHRSHNRHHANSNASVNYVSKAQWNGRITDVRNFINYLKEVTKQYENGNQPLKLNFENLAKTLVDLKDHQHEPVSYWLAQLKNSSTLENKVPKEQTKLLQIFASNHVLNEAFAKASGGNFEQAKAILVELKLVSTDQTEAADKMIVAIEKLIPFTKEGIDFWCNRMKGLVDAKQDPKEMEFVLVSAIANNYVLKEVFQAASQNEFTKAKENLTKLKESDSANAEMVDRLIDKLEFAAKHTEEESSFWFSQLEQIKQTTAKLKKEKEEEIDSLYNSNDKENKAKDSNVELENSMAKCTSIANIQKCSEKRSNLGYYREAAKILQDLKNQEADLDLDVSIRKLIFLHNGQMVSIFIKPLQAIVSRFVSGLQPSRKKTIALGSLEVVNTVQSLIPNSLTLALQGIHAGYKGDSSIFTDNLKELSDQLIKDLKRPDKSFNGFMFYEQVILKLLHAVPLQRFAPKSYRSFARHLKDRTLYYGNIIHQCLTTGNTLYQLGMTGMEGANLPQQLLSLVQVGTDYGISRYHSNRLAIGEGIEEPDFYVRESMIMPALQTLVATWSVARINGGMGRWTFAIGLAGLLYTFYNLTCNATKNDANEKALANAIGNIQFHSQLKALQYYVMNAKYKLIVGDVSTEELEKIKKGKTIVFASSKQQPSNTNQNCFSIYYLGKTKNNFERKELSKEQNDIVCNIWDGVAKEVASGETRVISLDNINLKILAKSYILSKNLSDDKIVNCISASRQKITEILNSNFGGLKYNKNQNDVVNDARVTLFYYLVKDAYDREDIDTVLSLTKRLEDQIAFGKNFELPPHLSWQVIVSFRLALYAQRKELLLNFWSEYQTYSKYIYEAAPNSWSDIYWEIVSEELKHIVQFAMQQCIIAATKESAKDYKLSYLAMLVKVYSYQKEWHELLSDELKFWAAAEYYKFADKDSCLLFLKHIRDLPKLMKDMRKYKDFSADVLTMLSELDNAKHRKILLLENPEQYGITKELMEKQILNLFAQEKYDDLLLLLNQVGDIEHKNYYLALTTFALSNETAILETIKFLLKEKSEARTLAYWTLFYDVLQRSLSSITYCSDEKIKSEMGVKLFCLIKICADYIQKFNPNKELKRETIKMGDIAIEYISSYLQDNAKINSLINFGHQCLRGENEINVSTEIETILSQLSYDYVDKGVRKKYLPIGTPADDDCLFHVFGISRDKAISLLMQHVTSANFLSKKIFGDKQRKDVIEILLADLEIKNNTKYNRDEVNFATNVKLITNYLLQLSQPRTWMPYNQLGPSVLDALALLLKKNLRIYINNQEGKLLVVSEMIHDDKFETIEMLHTSAEGFCTDERQFNHYIHLKYLPLQCEEVLDKKPSISKAKHAAFYKPRHNTLHVVNSDCDRPIIRQGR